MPAATPPEPAPFAEVADVATIADGAALQAQARHNTRELRRLVELAEAREKEARGLDARADDALLQLDSAADADCERLADLATRLRGQADEAAAAAQAAEGQVALRRARGGRLIRRRDELARAEAEKAREDREREEREALAKYQPDDLDRRRDDIRAGLDDLVAAADEAGRRAGRHADPAYALRFRALARAAAAAREVLGRAPRLQGEG